MSAFFQFRYYYPTETGFYYLQSRYYDPVTHRFINADSYASTGQGIVGTNMFAYCLNNPVLCVDFWGTYPLFWEMCVLKDHSSGGLPVGNAEPYWGDEPAYEDGADANCLGYALHLYETVGIHGYGYWPERGFSNSSDDLEHTAMLLADTLARYGYGIRPINSHDSPIFENEYRIAMRIRENDYHFMVQHSNGLWSHKPGKAPPQLLRITNPSQINWNQAAFVYNPVIGVWGVDYNYKVNYYYSNTVYFAISPPAR